LELSQILCSYLNLQQIEFVSYVMKTNLPNPQTCELLSALADGELHRDELSVLLPACAQDPSALRSWNAYQLIGDVLRSSAGAAGSADMTFLNRFNRRLALESLAEMSIGKAESSAPKHLPQPGVLDHERAAANDGNFRWKLLAGFASLAAVFVIGWTAMGSFSPLSPVLAPQLAQTPVQDYPVQQVVVTSPQGPMVRDARLEELIAAHKQMGGMSALQVPSGFLRNATFETPQGTPR
jgi:sigma-E factor negative regulatory protein RseA